MPNHNVITRTPSRSTLEILKDQTGLHNLPGLNPSIANLQPTHNRPHSLFRKKQQRLQWQQSEMTGQVSTTCLVSKKLSTLIVTKITNSK